ncbi:MAG: hypothetical protein EBU49_14765, partial [Proteobacteria bacterium]|nr:hypothetical protein [Pseudomonadota bacterium]
MTPYEKALLFWKSELETLLKRQEFEVLRENRFTLESYRWYLRETYFHTRENPISQLIATRSFSRDQHDLLSKYVGHARSEITHDQLALQDFIAKHPEVADPIKILFRQNRSLGRHAGGVIVSENIAERMPLILARGEPQTPWAEGMAAKHLEELGWIKFDLLGLETLRIIERCISLILQRHEGIANPNFQQIRAWFDEHMDPKNIDLNDQRVYEYVYHEGRFAGIFQLANAGAQRLFMRAKPTSILDIATLTSIYRPGPLAANVDKLYLDSKANPDKIDYLHPLIKKVLEPTFGCIIFQESVMKLCSVVAGFPETETDTIRRNIMKKTTAKDGAKGVDEAKKSKV